MEWRGMISGVDWRGLDRERHEWGGVIRSQAQGLRGLGGHCHGDGAPQLTGLPSTVSIPLTTQHSPWTLLGERAGGGNPGELWAGSAGPGPGPLYVSMASLCRKASSLRRLANQL